MKNSWQKLAVVFSLILILTITVFLQNQTRVKISSENEIKEDVELVPCENDDLRLEEVKKLFKKMGAKDEDLIIEDFKKVENLVLTVKGKSNETVIVGAHYDKTSTGCGAIDNWTGIVIMSHLYRTVKDFDTKKTYKFVAFGKEEIGLIGSRAMAKSIPKEERGSFCAMVNLDSFGFTYPQALGNTSDKSLIKIAEDVAKELKIPFADASLTTASSDSASFQEIKIPAITLHGLSNSWKNYLHTSDDKLKNVNSNSVYIGYRFGLQFLAKIDSSGCGDFR